MRKRLIAMLGAMMGLVAMATVASAGTVTVDYDAVNSTNSIAKYNVYANGLSNKVTSLQLELSFTNDTVVDLSNFTADDITYQSGLENCSATIKASKKAAKIQTYSSASVPFSFVESEPIMVIEMPVKSTAAKSAITAVAKGIFTDGTPTTSIEQILPMSAAVTGTKVSEDAGSDPATYFKVTNAPLAGTAYWYADFAGTAKKLAANVPNTEGTANLGFVYTGADAPTSVKIVCE